jgi:hypothetical protein
MIHLLLAHPKTLKFCGTGSDLQALSRICRGVNINTIWPVISRCCIAMYAVIAVQ